MVLFEIREFYKPGNESKFILVIYRKAVFCFRQNLFSTVVFKTMFSSK